MLMICVIGIHFIGNFGGGTQWDSKLYNNMGLKKGTSDVVLSVEALDSKGLMKHKT